MNSRNACVPYLLCTALGLFAVLPTASGASLDPSLIATSSITILSNGNVGIGTTTPEYLLSVDGDMHTSGNIISDNANYSIFGYSNPESISIVGGLTDNLQVIGAAFAFGGNQSTAGSIVPAGGAALYLDTAQGNPTDFFILNHTDTGSIPLFDVSSNGNVGIGTTSPLSLFSVGTAGNAFRIDATGTVEEGIWNGSTIDVARGGTGQTSFLASQLLYGNGTGGLMSVATSSVVAGTGVTFGGVPGYVIGGSGFTINTPWTISGNTIFSNNSGNVGIGLTNPNNKFQVKNLINFDDTLSNIALGTSALNAVTSGSYNVALGTLSFASMTTGANNIGIGWLSGYRNTTGFNNIYIGRQAGQSGVAAYGNTAIGVSALMSNVVGVKTVALGTSALINSNSVYGENTAVGYYSQWNATTGYYNTTVGYKAGEGIVSGFGNTVVGFDGMLYNNSGVNNVAVGLSALRHTAASASNVAMGAEADYFAPGAVTATVAAGAGLGVGMYSYRVSYVLDGVETTLGTVVNNGSPVTTVAGRQAINLTAIPTYTGPKTCTARKMYRTKANGTGSGDGAGLYYYLATLNDCTTTSYTDTIPDSSLGSGPSEPNGSIMLGYGAKAFGGGQMIVGSGSAPISQLYIGAGVYDGAPPAISINATGGQGTNTAGASMTIAGGIGTGSGMGGAIYFSTADAGSSGDKKNSLTRRLAILGNGNVGIGTSAPDLLLSVGSSTPVGAVARFQNASGSCYINPTSASLDCSSDSRLKKNITTLSLGASSSTRPTLAVLNAVEALRPVTYNWDKEASSTATHTGFVAQEVQTIFPDLVSQASDGYFTMNYAGLTPYLVKAMQELVTSLAHSVTTMVLNATTGNFGAVNTDNLCVKKSDGSNVCVTGDQLDALLHLSGQHASTPVAPLPLPEASTATTSEVVLEPPLTDTSSTSASSTPLEVFAEPTVTSATDTASSSVPAI